MEGNCKNSCMGAYKDTLDIKLTDACNGKCGFCIEKGGKLSTSVPVKEFIEKVISINPKSVLVLGGEPFLYPHLGEFIEGISGREIFITTNGSGLKNIELVERIAPHLTALNISLMHFGMGNHYEVTNIHLIPNDIKEAIKILHKYNVSVRINSILLNNYLDNNDDCNSMIEFAKFLGADDIRFSEVQEQPDMFVDAKTIFDGLHNNPYTEGCEQKLNYNGINIIVKQTCSLVNSLKIDNVITKNNGCGGSSSGGGCLFQKEGVLYADLTHSKNGWITTKNDDCHKTGGEQGGGYGCHR